MRRKQLGGSLALTRAPPGILSRDRPTVGRPLTSPTKAILACSNYVRSLAAAAECTRMQCTKVKSVCLGRKYQIGMQSEENCLARYETPMARSSTHSGVRLAQFLSSTAGILRALNQALDKFKVEIVTRGKRAYDGAVQGRQAI